MKELEEARGEARHVRELWYQTCVDIQNECQKKLEEKDKEHSRQIRDFPNSGIRSKR